MGAAEQSDLKRASGFHGFQHPGNLVHMVDFYPCNLGNPVTRMNPSMRGRPVGSDRYDQQPRSR